jgi:hypothetical protein
MIQRRQIPSADTSSTSLPEIGRLPYVASSEHPLVQILLPLPQECSIAAVAAGKKAKGLHGAILYTGFNFTHSRQPQERKNVC